MQVTFSGASKKNIDFVFEKSLFLSCLGPVHDDTVVLSWAQMEHASLNNHD